MRQPAVVGRRGAPDGGVPMSAATILAIGAIFAALVALGWVALLAAEIRELRAEIADLRREVATRPGPSVITDLGYARYRAGAAERLRGTP